MRRYSRPLGGLALAVALGWALPAQAQAVAATVDPASVEMPDLVFEPDAEDEKNYNKYYYFHREGTDFPGAYADLQECDSYSRGFGYHAGGGAVPYPYAGTVAGAVGGAIGSALADAVFGSAERRKLRRINMRTCMGFKEYKAYGLRKGLWTKFNFEEGLGEVGDEKRQRLLQMQAKVASGPKPAIGEIVGEIVE